jgi:hypothetical protein
VTTEITRPAHTDDAEPTISEQQAALQAMASLSSVFGSLPGAYLMIHAPYMPGLPTRIGMQLNSPQAFEQWREVLQIPSMAINLHTKDDGSWLSADIDTYGVPLHLTGFGVPLTADQAFEPRDTSEVAA